jgi:hypothetical protein
MCVTYLVLSFFKSLALQFGKPLMKEFIISIVFDDKFLLLALVLSRFYLVLLLYIGM